MAYAAGRPDGGFLSSSPAAPVTPGPTGQTPKRPTNRNIDRQANVVATLQAVNGVDNLDQTNNNQGNKNDYFNSIFAGGSSFLNVKDSAGNVVGGLQEAKGRNNVTQNTNDDNNTNNVKNHISQSDAGSVVSFDAANTSGKAMEITGSNDIGQDQNNDAGFNEFTNQ